MAAHCNTDAAGVTIAASKMMSGCAGRVTETATAIWTVTLAWSVETTTATTRRGFVVNDDDDQGDVREASGILMMTAARRSAPRLTLAARERAAARMTLAVRTVTSSSVAPQTVTQRYLQNIQIMVVIHSSDAGPHSFRGQVQKLDEPPEH